LSLCCFEYEEEKEEKEEKEEERSRIVATSTVEAESSDNRRNYSIISFG